ncbi:hypothetical protein H5410_062612 [Solanum commersonii]|uniref:Uncharacterized protein n=1 Tax=Solanum commersonii TaxID=4109 RepID=A0A9J5WD69_SOLCO|nr:hypothetical protein H5410_062612 [Solanum commersonii]
MNVFFRSNPKLEKLRALFCFTKDPCIFSQLAHLDFKLLQVLVVVMSQDGYGGFTMGNKFGKMSCFMLSAIGGGLIPVPKTLEVLKLKFCNESNEQINLSSYPNIVKLHLNAAMRLNCEAFPPNLVKLTLVYLTVDDHVVAVLKKLPKLRILKMVVCEHKKEEMDLSGDGFPQLEVLHIQNPLWLPEITCTDDASMPKLNKLLLVDTKCESQYVSPNVLQS